MVGVRVRVRNGNKDRFVAEFMLTYRIKWGEETTCDIREDHNCPFVQNMKPGISGETFGNSMETPLHASNSTHLEVSFIKGRLITNYK